MITLETTLPAAARRAAALDLLDLLERVARDRGEQAAGGSAGYVDRLTAQRDERVALAAADELRRGLSAPDAGVPDDQEWVTLVWSRASDGAALRMRFQKAREWAAKLERPWWVLIVADDGRILLEKRR